MIDTTPLMRLYARWRLHQIDGVDPATAQERQLLRLVDHAKDTAFGRAHGFAEIRSVADFQRRVPLRAYEDFWEGWWKDRLTDLAGQTWPDPIPYLAVTSGTSSGTTKYIPVSRQMVASNRKAGIDLLCRHVIQRPRSRIFGGKNFMLGGAVDLKTMEGPDGKTVKYGDLTGIALNEVPRPLRRLTFPPAELARESDWEKKIATVGRASLERDIRTLAGTASWLLIFFEKLNAMRPGDPRLVRFYPNLELLIHGGVNFAPYRERFEAWMEGSHAERREVYPASEGFIAFSDADPDDGLRLTQDLGLFFEFVPFEELEAETPTRHWVRDLEVGREYAVIVSNCAGMWAYVLGDLVRFVSKDPPRLVVTGRTSDYLSAFGEHLTGEEVRLSVERAAEAIGESVAEYSVGPLFPSVEDERGGHVFAVELEGVERLTPEAQTAFAEALDRALCETNDDYRDHRAGDIQIRPPCVRFVPPGTFADWMRSRGKLGGQNKVPRVVTNPEILQSLQDFTKERAIGGQ
jgi:hypothetical protein